MRHGKRNIKFGRHPAHRKATLISLASNLIRYNRIETTLAKAKEAKRLADKIITWGKKGSLHHRRLVYSLLGDRDLVGIVFKDLAPLFANRQGGYTRIIQTRIRQGDGAQLAILEWTEKKEEAPKEKKQAKKEKARVQAKTEPKKEAVEKSKPAEPEKPKHVVEKPSRPQEEKPPKKEEPRKKGFLGGLRKLFDRKKNP